MRPPVPIHNVRANHAEWTPAVVCYLDTETVTRPHPAGELLALRLWVARLDVRRPKRRTDPVRDYRDGDTADELADVIDGWSRRFPSLWLYAHNLAFDLSTTRLPDLLAARGWELGDAALSGKAPWLRMRHGSRRLCLSDSWSWLPVALEQVGAVSGRPKPPLPAARDDRAAWLARCRGDVDVMAGAISDLMTWWDRAGLGRWTITGAAAGWNAYRHIKAPQPVTVDPDPDGVRSDRAAVHGGRRSVWCVGTYHAGPYLELDLEAAHLTVCRDLPLPVKRTRRFDTLPVDHWAIGRWDRGILAQCTIATDRPRWPCRVGGQTFYPVGRFVTTLADPDIVAARTLGALEAVGPGYMHRVGWNMVAWAHWCKRVLDGEVPDAPAVARVAAKAWGRSVPGKWASRTWETVELGASPFAGWAFEDGWDADTRARASMLSLAGKRWLAIADQEPDNGYPAILAWIEAYVRTRLANVIDALGPNCVMQANTDGLIVRESVMGSKTAGGLLRAPKGLTGPAKTRWAMDMLAPLVAPLTLRIKRTAKSVTVLGPQHYQAGGERKFSGIPAIATQAGPGVYRFKQWPSLSWQLQRGDERGYVRPEREVTVVGPYAPGWVLADGRVDPVECEIGADGATRIVPWQRSRFRTRGAYLAPRQVRTLDRLA